MKTPIPVPSAVYVPHDPNARFRKVKFNRRVRPTANNRFASVRENWPGYAFRVPESRLPDLWLVVCRGSSADDMGHVRMTDKWVVHLLDGGFPMPAYHAFDTRAKAVRHAQLMLLRLTVTHRDLVFHSSFVTIPYEVEDMAGRKTTQHRLYREAAKFDVELDPLDPCVRAVNAGALEVPTMTAGRTIAVVNTITKTLPRGQQWLQSYLDFKHREAAIRALEAN